MNKRRNGKRRYISELDGLRGLAVLAVIFYHLGFDWAAGGFLGVCIFFVLSGYLITDLLADEWKQNKRINFKKFWIKRARRLLPAMLAMLILTFIWVLLFKPTIIASFKSDFIAALFYISNWWYIFQDQSYFETLGEPSLLTHFWSLAVEEQFYIIWPILMLLGLRYITKLSLIKIMLITASVSAILMMLLYQLRSGS
ncbi:acyltransferase [Virgibacillus salarius]|uniref:acyltransferase family protein n=1 Tax=Virgibacillus salarius TaxID=447199 RepID=UPI0024928A95|nr:acyltransferase [Virgibacillus salarius]WBX82009.1 acyltransferase [Virgibacillus salarius]